MTQVFLQRFLCCNPGFGEKKPTQTNTRMLNPQHHFTDYQTFVVEWYFLLHREHLKPTPYRLSHVQILDFTNECCGFGAAPGRLLHFGPFVRVVVFQTVEANQYRRVWAFFNYVYTLTIVTGLKRSFHWPWQTPVPFPPCICLFVTGFQKPGIQSCKELKSEADTHTNKAVLSKIIATPARLCPC